MGDPIAEHAERAEFSMSSSALAARSAVKRLVDK
jgi:hypothetical protein